MVDKKTIIYIAGYGRSGSTLLDAILGNSEQAINAGELNTIFDEVLEGNNCSCGQSYVLCKRWSPLFSTLQKIDLIQLRKINRDVDGRQSVLRPHAKMLSSEQKELYIKATSLVFNRLASPFIIDSSKTAQNSTYRPIALRDISGFDVKVIHLKRKFFPVLKSISKGSNRKMLGKKDIRVKFLAQFGFRYKNPYFENDRSSVVNLVRGAVGYWLANREAAQLKEKFGDDNFLRLDFELLVQDPLEVMSQIEKQFSICLSNSRNIIKGDGVFKKGHIVGGNRLAQNDIIIDPSA
jgi:hypothetical protein